VKMHIENIYLTTGNVRRHDLHSIRFKPALVVHIFIDCGQWPYSGRRVYIVLHVAIFYQYSACTSVLIKLWSVDPDGSAMDIAGFRSKNIH